MKRALNLLRDSVPRRKRAFTEGLMAAGYEVQGSAFAPRAGDVLVCWNRYSRSDELARAFEAVGGRVLVTENGYLPESLIGPGWYALAEGHHAGAGRWPKAGPERWARLGVELAPWREGGEETVILGQRGIGERGVASPRDWEEVTRRRIGGRIRPHPGLRGTAPDLEKDLRSAACAVTWASSAGLTALRLGIPVFYGMPRWIGAGAARPVAEFGSPARDDAARLEVFLRVAAAMSHIDEIRSGEAFCRLLAH